MASTTINSIELNNYQHGEDIDNSIVAAGEQALDLDFLTWKLQQPATRKSQLSSYFKGVMEFYQPPPPLSPSPMSSRCSSPSRESARYSSDSSESDRSTGTDGGRRVVKHDVKTKTKESKFKRDVIKRPAKRVYRVGKVGVSHSMKTRSRRKSHKSEASRTSTKSVAIKFLLCTHQCDHGLKNERN